jgi:hypothetical protein
MLELLPTDLTTITIGGIGLPVLLVFLTQSLKGLLPEKLVGLKPYVPFLLGILMSFVIMGISPIAFLGGLFLGLVATGEYRMVNPSVEK